MKITSTRTELNKMYANEFGEQHNCGKESSILFPRRGEWGKLNKERRENGWKKTSSLAQIQATNARRTCTNSRYKKRPFAGRRKETKGRPPKRYVFISMQIGNVRWKERNGGRGGKERETRMTNRLSSLDISKFLDERTVTKGGTKIRTRGERGK